MKRLLNGLGITVNVVLPEGSLTKEIPNLTKAWFNLVPYREIGLMAAVYLKKRYNMPYVSIAPMGNLDIVECVQQISSILSQADPSKDWNFDSYLDTQLKVVSQAGWFARSIDCQNLTGKRAVVFGDAEVVYIKSFIVLWASHMQSTPALICYYVLVLGRRI